MIQPLLLLILAGTALAGILQPRDMQQLLLLQTVIRHGDRAATDRFATDASEKVLFRGLGEMSDDGINNAQKQGAAFRKRYVNELKFIDGRYLPSEVEFRGSPVSRVLMSAGSFGNGLFHKTPKGNDVAVPVLANKPDPNTALEKMEETMWPESCKDVPSNKADAIISELPNKAIRMPASYVKCAKLPAKQFMYDYISLLGGSGDHFNEMRLKRTAGLLTNELLANMNEMANCGPNCEGKKKFHVYYTHDVNVLALSHVFQCIEAYNKITPAFSSAIIIELWWSERMGYHVKTYLNNGHDSPFVAVGPNRGVNTLSTVTEFAGAFAVTEPVSCEK